MHDQAAVSSREIRRVLIWGRGARLDGAYSRDRVIYRLLTQLGATLRVFSPIFSFAGDLEAILCVRGDVDLVWVPCFRQRDVLAASRFARRHSIPLVFDPLISAYDKRVNEREKYAETSSAARKLLERERRQFAVADLVVADTTGHADYFHDVLGVPRARLLVLPVGADESVFRPVPPRTLAHDERVRLLFYGSFIRLHGVPTIVAALRDYAGPPMHCRFIGEGPMRAQAEAALRELDPARVDVEFEDWLAFEALPERIAAADIVLGIFGTTPKALRVVPNKVYQALAAGRPVITADTPAYDESFRTVDPAAIGFVPPGDASALSGLLADWAAARDRLAARGQAAANVFERAFAESRLRERLMSGLDTHGIGCFPDGGALS
jgi:glycosyltransferase involved in cell wall biosynthesis